MLLPKNDVLVQGEVPSDSVLADGTNDAKKSVTAASYPVDDNAISLIAKFPTVVSV